MNNEKFLHLLYRSLLHRDPEPGAVQAWINQMRAGLSEADVTAAFLSSDEYLTVNTARARLFRPPGHFYSPIVDVSTVAHLFGDVGWPSSLPGIDLNPTTQLAMWRRLLPHLQSAPFSKAGVVERRYRPDNPAYGVGDASVYFAMLMTYRPHRIVEIGSGFSSACALDTIEHHLRQEVNVTFVEPYPQLLDSLLTSSDRVRTTIIPSEVQSVDLDVFRSLDSGDFLFIDSTHVLKTGSDVHFELFEILPALNPGVHIHIHDTFWPFQYPRSWVVDENRSWNELYALRAFLMYNNNYSIEFFNDYFAKVHHDTVQRDFPMMLDNPGGALWLLKNL
ncbi:class I SAM-dependent methyltransferase [Methylotetracoccus oryzae]|uniref:class I SAM-dependent methyltransferase n=1 Tax=Methylotetracoccus oryzae TaxID=1919059 RepID=UPI001118DEE3|nr:class I SAM-dependent methyltransferase [Methylotetracoccus oryzae]